MKTLFVLASVMVGLFLAAPNEVKAQKQTAIPAERTVNSYLQSRVTSQSDGDLSLAGFRKMNGYQMGYGVSVIEWQAEILVEQECWKPGDMFVGHWEDFRVLLQQPGGMDFLVVGNAKHLKKGITIRLAGESSLRNTEQGWRVEGLSVKTARVLTGRIINGVSQGTSQLYVAPSGGFSYNPPDGSVLRDLAGQKNKAAVLPESEIVITVGEASFSGTLDDYVAFSLREVQPFYAKMGVNTYRVLSQSEFITDAKARGVKHVAQFQTGGKWLRQTTYYFDGKNGKRFVVGCLGPAQAAEAYNKIFDKSMKTFKTPASN